MRERPDVADLLSRGRRLHEVPFSYRVAGDSDPVVLRGTIDCLVEREDGNVVVMEFKTGRARAADRQQLDLYVTAAQALFPDTTVEGLLVYLD
jgi:RecB family exonuclease